ncbi:MAG: type II toxin-antitoxin system death-on-curing family toxin [Succinivibrio sp.]|nr:type II toxin-antitoxin system death-on-curing family toxin [Succinivibrio sp.]
MLGVKDIFILSATYLNSVTDGHIFPNGHKRTALATCGLFLFQNGFLLPDSQAANLKLADLTLKSTNHEISNEILANGIKSVAIAPTQIFSKNLVKSFHR